MLASKQNLLVASAFAVVAMLQPAAQAQLTIGQSAGSDFIAFEAEDVWELVGAEDAGWATVTVDNPYITRNGIAAVAPNQASRDGAILDLPGGGVNDFARWRLQFVEPGDYHLYIKYTMYDVNGDASYGNEDSVYISSAFGTDGVLVDTPADPRGARDDMPSFYGNVPTSGASFGDGTWEGNFSWWNAEADGSDPTAENTDAVYTPELNTALDFGIAARERGIAIDKIVFHQNSELSDEELDALVSFAPNTGNPGDFNDDGMVDLQDFVIMAENFDRRFSVVESFAKGDQNRDGLVDLKDFVQVRQIFNNPSGAAVASVPEPSTLSLVLGTTAAIGVLWRRRRR